MPSPTSLTRLAVLLIAAGTVTGIHLSAVAAEPAPSQAELQPLRATIAETLTLDQSQSLALTQNRDIKRARLEVSRSEAALKSIIATRYPKISALTFWGEQVTQPHGANFAVLPGVFQPITQLYRTDMQVKEAGLAVKVSKEQLRLTMQQTIATLKKTYLNIVALKASIKSRESNLAFLEQLEKYVTAAERAGSALHVDPSLIRAKVAHADYDLDKDRDDLITLKQTFNRLLARPVDRDFDVLELQDRGKPSNILPPSPVYTQALATTRALADRPELHQNDAQVKQFRLKQKIEVSRYIPDISVGATGIFSHRLDITLPKTFLSVGFLSTWEPWDWGRRLEVAKIAERQRRQSEIALADLRDKVSIEADNARRALLLIEKELKAAELEESSSAENLRVLTKRYKAGSSLMKDVTEAQSNYSEAITFNVKAKVHYAEAQVDWDLALGRDPRQGEQ